MPDVLMDVVEGLNKQALKRITYYAVAEAERKPKTIFGNVVLRLVRSNQTAAPAETKEPTND